jgi:hypothetical protein
VALPMTVFEIMLLTALLGYLLSLRVLRFKQNYCFSYRSYAVELRNQQL